MTIDFVGKAAIAASCKKTAKQVLAIAQKSKPMSGYEVLTGGCIPYYDFDYAYDDEKTQQAEENNDRQKSINAVQKAFPGGELFVFSSNGLNLKKQYKNSYHILVRGCGYADCGKSLPAVDFSDPNVYAAIGKRQLFRLPYLSKEKENRPLVLNYQGSGEIFAKKDVSAITPEEYARWCISNVEGEELKWTTNDEERSCSSADGSQYVDKIAEVFPEVVRYKQHYRTTEQNGALFINYRDVVKEQCVLCKRVHEDNQFYGYLSKDKKLFYKCKKHNASIFVHNFGEAHSFEKRIISEDVHNRLDKYNPEKFKSRYVADYKRFMDAFSQEGIIAIASGTGTGKTHASALALRLSKQKAGVLSFRIALAKKYTQDFPGFTCYRDDAMKGKAITADQWICQLDSLYRVKSKPEVLIIDEINQVRRHLHAETFMKNKNYLNNRAALHNLIRNTKTIVVMDANLSPLELNWLKRLRPEGNIKLFLNTAVPNKKTITMVANQDRLLSHAKKDLVQGRQIVIAHNGGKRHHEPLKRLLLDACPNKQILVINSDTKDKNKNVMRALDNPNTEFGKYDCIIYSPSVQSGVSYDEKGVFYRVYGLFSNCTNSSGDACQMMDRIRHPVCNNPIVSIEEYPSSVHRSIDVMKNHIMAIRGHIRFEHDNSGIGGLYNSYDEVEFVQNEILDERCAGDVEQNIDRANFKANFIAHQHIYGNVIEYENLSVDELKKTKEEDGKSKSQRQQFTAQVKSEAAAELNNAVNISIEEVNALREQLQKQEKVAAEKLLALKKFNLNNFYKMDEPVNDAKWYETYDNATLKNQFYRSSKYFVEGKTPDMVLEELKLYEIQKDRRARSGYQNSEPATTDECVVKFLLSKPKYQKEKILVGWIKDLGYDIQNNNKVNILNSTAEIDEERMKMRIANCIANMNDTMFDVLEKKREKLKVLKKLKIDDKNFMKSALAFINGSLKSYFGVSVRKKDRNSQFYIMINTNINDKKFVLPNDINGLFKENTPVLGKQLVREDKDELTEDEIKELVASIRK